MSEVEKMYENAGVEPKAKCNSGACIVTNPSQTWCKQCESLDCSYPPITAEKKLLLIQWLAKTRPIHITFLIDKWVIEGMVRYGKRYDTFEDALSGYINNIWKDLTEQERTEIAEILRGVGK